MRLRQNAFCERKDAFHVEFFELTCVTVDPREPELLAQFLGVAVVRFNVDRPLEENRLVQAPAPEGVFTLTMRCYSPRPQILTGEWVPPPATTAR